LAFGLRPLVFDLPRTDRGTFSKPKDKDQKPKAKGHSEKTMSSIEHLITVADLEKLPDDGNRYELIEGELYVSSAPRLPHQFVLQNLQVALVNFLIKNPIGRVVAGAGAVFSNFDVVIPDLVFVSNERWSEIVANDRFIAAPDIVIEVLSPGAENRRRDLVAKHRLYHKCGVQEYWVVDQENRSVLLYRYTKHDEVKFNSSEALRSDFLPGFEITVENLLKY
jgi:Uma2 family endonuclease